MNRYLLIRRLYGPAYLLLTGVIALLAQTTDFGWGKSWPLYLLLGGVLKLAEFIVLRTDGPPPPAGWQAGQPYPGQPYPGQPYPGQPYPGQPYPGQPYPGQNYPGYPPQQQPPTATSTSVGTGLVSVDPRFEEKK